jgi:hypothetical protein
MMNVSYFRLYENTGTARITRACRKRSGKSVKVKKLQMQELSLLQLRGISVNGFPAVFFRIFAASLNNINF